MRGRRWPWCVTAVLMVAAAAAAARSTFLHWLPCDGSLLSGTIVRGYQYDKDLSDACLHRMDAGLPFPYLTEPAEMTPGAAELGIAAMLLSAMAWIALLLAARLAWRTTVVAALPGLVTLALATSTVVALGTSNRNPNGETGWLWLVLDLATVAAAVGLWRSSELDRRELGRLLLVLWGTAAFSVVHMTFEYTFMLVWSDANWDTPPSTGYLTAATIAGSALLTVALTFRRPRRVEAVPAGPADVLTR